MFRRHSRFQRPVISTMSSLESRIYRQDIFGRRVLAGLTYAETHELELLDTQPPVDDQGNLLRWEIDEGSFPPRHARWLELFKKHQAACTQFRKR